MSNVKSDQYLRVIDANYNRAKEGLRVCEDIARFYFDKKNLTRNLKDIRHELAQGVEVYRLDKVIEARSIEKDVGRQSTQSEFKRKDINDLLLANSARVKESIRVLEEFSKLKHKTAAERFKELRYRFYALEQKIIRQL